MEKTDFYYIRKVDVCKMLGGISRSTLERMVAAGTVPEPYRLGKRTVVWRSDEVEQCLSSMPRLEGAYGKQLRRAR